MYADNTLTPKEATRLCALGMLAEGDKAYAELAAGVRHFVTHVMGPSLDVLGTSIELLKYEGLVDTTGGDGDAAILRINDSGMEELRTLLLANLKQAENDLNKLITALKFRFIDVLSAEERQQQLDKMLHAIESEMARLEDLRVYHAEDGGHLIDWLDREIDDLESRHAWLEAKRTEV